eukprot:scaffold13793_cov165-Amphora_coffeaeformis.AAC.5
MSKGVDVFFFTRNISEEKVNATIAFSAMLVVVWYAAVLPTTTDNYGRVLVTVSLPWNMLLWWWREIAVCDASQKNEARLALKKISLLMTGIINENEKLDDDEKVTTGRSRVEEEPSGCCQYHRPHNLITHH